MSLHQSMYFQSLHFTGPCASKKMSIMVDLKRFLILKKKKL